MEPKGLHQLYLDQLRSLYNAETQQIPLLAELVQTTTDEECRVIFGKHLEQTNNHVDRLEQIFAQLGEKPEGQQCVLMKALVQEVHEIVLRNYGPYASMAALIGAFQHIEHHEIAGYGTVRSFARQLNEDEAANTLQHTLNEEAQADRWLSELAEYEINVRAAEVSEHLVHAYLAAGSGPPIQNGATNPTIKRS